MRTILILTLMLPLTIGGYNIFDSTKRPLLTFLVGNGNIPRCLSNCTLKIREEMMKFVSGNIKNDSFDRVCRVYNATTNCLSSSCQLYETVFKKLLKGFEWACGHEGQQALKRVSMCMWKLIGEARQEQKCEKKCNLLATSLFEAPLNGTLVNTLMGRLSNFCRPLECYLSCTRKQMNDYCPTSGTRLINLVTSTFYELADELQYTTTYEKKEILKAVPNDCRVYLDLNKINKFQYDKVFIRDFISMYTFNNQKTSLNVGRELNRIVDKLVMNRDDVNEKKPKTWDAQSILIVSGMGIVMLVTIVGLILSIWWCLNTKQETGNIRIQSNGLSVDHFLEPNIIMKIKARNDIIEEHNNIPGFMQVRIPRNGNQFAMDEEQTTVMVPRWNRRRTLSVPLEPRRTRFESTTSDKGTVDSQILSSFEEFHE